MCRTDRETLCADLSFLGQEASGGYAEYVLINDDNLARLPDNVDFAHGAIVGCPSEQRSTQSAIPARCNPASEC